MAADHLRDALRAHALLALGPRRAPTVTWLRCKIPTIADVSVLEDLLRGAGLDVRRHLHDFSPPTILERSDGNWEASLSSQLAGTGVHLDRGHSAASFEEFILPASESLVTRRKAWVNWKGVLTWALATDSLSCILPMSGETLKALLWDFLSLGCSSAILKAVLDCIQSRHRYFGLESPLQGACTYRRLMHCLLRFQGRQRPLKYPIHRSLVVRFLSCEFPSLLAFRNCLAAAECHVPKE